MTKNLKKPTPSQFYRERRPENFSDSEVIHETQLTPELLAYQLSQISVDQKQDQFETLSRRLAEKYIAPNLIPQVGPTGGGDGKTDTETHSVSERISSRWFVPENGWTKDEKWAFAISSKEDWKSKLKSDIKSIQSTKREYTKIFFFTNRKPSSKKKKDAQDEFKKEFGIDVEIFDGEWILEKTINDPQTTNLVVDALNLSASYKASVRIGANDSARLKRLEELEAGIKNPDRYFEYDYQLVEDALESAILSRELEKSRDEIVGRFDRALRFCKKVNQRSQLIRVHYQRAWTYINYFDDFSSFIKEFRLLKELIQTESSISEVELYFNLFNILKGIVSAEVFEGSASINLRNERDEILNLIKTYIDNREKPSSALIASTFKVVLELWDKMAERKDPDYHFEELSDLFSKSKGHIEYPFEMFKKIVEESGQFFPKNESYDSLLERIAEISSSRESQLSAAQIYLRRGATKYEANLYKQSVVFFGKALLKLAKEESKQGFYLALMGLSMAYDSLGLRWASYNSLVTATSLPNREWLEKGRFDSRMYRCVKKILLNELFIGRVPIFLSWYELDRAITSHMNINEDEDSQYSPYFLDAGLSVRLMDYSKLDSEAYSFLPDILGSQDLWMSQYSAYYCLGQTETLLNEFKKEGVTELKDKNQLDEHFERVAHQPFRMQMMYDTDLLSTEELSFRSVILGVDFEVTFKRNVDLLLFAEAILAFLESFLATSLTNVLPSTERIIVDLEKSNTEKTVKLKEIKASNHFLLEVGENYSEKVRDRQLWENVLNFLAALLASNFFIQNAEKHLTNLFKDEEINERCGLIFNHSHFVRNVMGKETKFFFEDWTRGRDYQRFEQKGKIPFEISEEKIGNAEVVQKKKSSFEDATHYERKVVSIIDAPLWDVAGWKGFGFYLSDTSPKLTIFLAFENEQNAKKIFARWNDRFGQIDEEEFIRITIIRGVSIENPAYYRIHISNNMEKVKLQRGQYLYSLSRFREVTPDKSENLDNLIEAFKHFKTYILAPVKITQNYSIEPIEGVGIIKTTLNVMEAWQLGVNDPESSVIDIKDMPIIPEDRMEDAPILEVLKKRREDQ